MKVIVRCSFNVEIEAPENWDAEHVRFAIEENSCPATGLVGSAIEESIERSNNEGVCWCCPTGENRIVSIDGVAVERANAAKVPVDTADGATYRFQKTEP